MSNAGRETVTESYLFLSTITAAFRLLDEGKAVGRKAIELATGRSGSNMDPARKTRYSVAVIPLARGKAKSQSIGSVKSIEIDIAASRWGYARLWSFQDKSVLWTESKERCAHVWDKRITLTRTSPALPPTSTFL